MMKKIFGRCPFIVLLLMVNCHNEPYERDIINEDNSCNLAIQATNEAGENYLLSTDDNSTILCLIYRDALEDQIEVCGDQTVSLQLLIDGLETCENDNSCEEAEEATEIARITYESAADETIEDLCNFYKDALEYQIDVCGDDGTLQNQIDDLECEPDEVEVAGTWRLISWNTDELRDIDNDGVTTNNYLDDIDCYDNETILFNSNGTGTIFLRSTAEFTYTPNDLPEGGEDFFMVCSAINIDRSFTWTETFNSVTLTFTDGTSMSLFKNGNLYIAIDDAFYATSTIDNSVISERITFIYAKL